MVKFAVLCVELDRDLLFLCCSFELRRNTHCLRYLDLKKICEAKPLTEEIVAIACLKDFYKSKGNLYYWLPLWIFLLMICFYYRKMMHSNYPLVKSKYEVLPIDFFSCLLFFGILLYCSSYCVTTNVHFHCKWRERLTTLLCSHMRTCIHIQNARKYTYTLYIYMHAQFKEKTY